MALPQREDFREERDSKEGTPQDGHLNDVGTGESEEDTWTGLREILVPEHLRAWLNQRGIYTKEEVLAHWDKGKRIGAALDPAAREILTACLKNSPVDLVKGAAFDDVDLDEVAPRTVQEDLEPDEILAEDLRQATHMLESTTVRVDTLLEALHDQRGQLAHYTDMLDKQISAIGELREEVDGKLRRTLEALERHFK